MKQEVLVVGMGNEFRNDDGLGIFIARQLKKENLPGIVVKEYISEGVGLLGIWTGFNHVVLVDAVFSGKEPGTIIRIEIPPEKIPEDLTRYSTHSFSIADAVEIAQSIGELPGHILIYGIEGKSFENGKTLSAEAEQSAEKVLKKIIEEIKKLKAEKVR